MVHCTVGYRGAGDLRRACVGVAVMTRDEIDEETYEWLTRRFGERVAEGLVPCPGHEWPLDAEEQDAARAHYERWADRQESDMHEQSTTQCERALKAFPPLPALEKLRGIVRMPFGYGVIDKCGEDVELFATRDEAIARARECHKKYIHIRPFRVVKITMEPLDDDPDEREVGDRESLTERRTCEAEERYRADTEGAQ